MSEWYYTEGNQDRVGPVPAQTLREAYAAGRLSLDALVWRSGMSGWEPLGQHAQELGLAQTQATMSSDTGQADLASQPATPAQAQASSAAVQADRSHAEPAPSAEQAWSLEPNNVTEVSVEAAASPVAAQPVSAPNEVWYYSADGSARQGPVSAQALNALGLPATAMVWREGLAAWEPITSHFAASAAAPAPSRSAQAIPGMQDVGGDPYNSHPQIQAASTQNPYAAPSAPLQTPAHAGVHHDHDVVYAGFRKRAAAYLIDYFIVAFGTGIVSLILGDTLGTLAAIVLAIAYYAGMHASTHQATLGKMAVGIKVVDDNGGRISFGRAVLRIFATILSAIIFLIGYIMAAFTERKRALHDILCSTLVVDKWAFTDRAHLQRRELGVVTIVVLVLYGLLVGLAVFGVLALGMLGASLGSL